MDAQDFRSLQEAYMEVVENQQLNEISDRKVAAVGRRRQASVNKVMDSDEYISDKPSVTQKLATNISKLNRFKSLEKRRNRRNKNVDENFDIYNIILSHLLDEGYAETPEAAEVIMVNMSEEWRQDIMEAEIEPPRERVGALTNIDIPEDERKAARERTLAKAAAAREKRKKQG